MHTRDVVVFKDFRICLHGHDNDSVFQNVHFGNVFRFIHFQSQKGCYFVNEQAKHPVFA